MSEANQGDRDHIIKHAHERISVGLDRGLPPETYKFQIDVIVSAMDRTLLTLSPDLHGHVLKERIFNLNSWMSYYNECFDRAKLKMEEQGVLVDKIGSLAIRQLRSGIETPPATLSKEYAETEDIELTPGGKKTTLNDERMKHVAYSYASNRFRSIFKNIESTIMHCQSGLALDRAEMISVNNQQRG